MKIIVLICLCFLSSILKASDSLRYEQFRRVLDIVDPRLSTMFTPNYGTAVNARTLVDCAALTNVFSLRNKRASGNGYTAFTYTKNPFSCIIGNAIVPEEVKTKVVKRARAGGLYVSSSIFHDDNECLGQGTGNNCDPNALCINTPGSFECSCPPGFTGDGISCIDENECLGQGTGNSCGPDSICTNTPGAFICTCSPGYSGDGITCIDDNECIGEGSGNNCDVNAICTNIPGSFLCTCHATYIGNGITCTPRSCPGSHPYPYTHGLWCCKNQREKTVARYGKRCDSSIIGYDSICCQNDELTACGPNNALCACVGSCITGFGPMGSGYTTCPGSHPYPYITGSSCCKVPRDCTGAPLGYHSNCCEGDQFVPCSGDVCLCTGNCQLGMG